MPYLRTFINQVVLTLRLVFHLNSNFRSLLPSYPTSNAVTIVKKLPNRNIFFIPDNNLARFMAKQVPDKHFIFNDGFCHVHKSIHSEDVAKAKELHPGTLVLAHPE